MKDFFSLVCVNEVSGSSSLSHPRQLNMSPPLVACIEERRWDMQRKEDSANGLNYWMLFSMQGLA